MAFDGFVTKAIVSELKNTIIGAKVNKVYEPTKNEVILSLYNCGNNYNLDICATPESCRICLTSYSRPNPQNAYNFCMLLRKYLIGGKIVSISSYDLERTVEIQFECYNELNDLVIRKLFVEIMSRQSNIILTNERNIIIDTLKHFDNNVRELLPAHEYIFTPITKISFLQLNNFDDFYVLLKNSGEESLIKFFINNFIGFSKPLMKETLKLLNIKDNEYSTEDLVNLYEYLNFIINNLGTSNLYCRKISEKDFTLFYDNRAQNTSNESSTQNITHINYFVDEFYYNKEQLTLFTNSVSISSIQ